MRIGKEKLRSTQAETLAELLVSVLVISLGLAMFATALMAARRMLQQGDTVMQGYYEGRNLLEQEADDAKMSEAAEVVLEKGTGSINLGAPESSLRAGHQKKGRYSVQLYAENRKYSSGDASGNEESRVATSGTGTNGTGTSGTGTSGTGTTGTSQNNVKNYRYQWVE